MGLLSGATLGGNLTPIRASANIAGLGILRKEISVPYAPAAVMAGYALVWAFWGA